VVSMLETVVEPGGTATKARMDEYRVAGKTGTAQKVDPIARGYSDKRIASFVGVVPAEDPRAVILVVIDEPKTDVYGGLVAAPAFKEIASQMMPHVGAPKSREMPVVAAKPEPVVAKPPPPPPAEGMLNLRASDTADVYLDGKKLGGSPLLGVKAKVGNHKVRFDCYDAAGNTLTGAAQTVSVKADGETDVEFTCPTE